MFCLEGFQLSLSYLFNLLNYIFICKKYPRTQNSRTVDILRVQIS